MLVAAAKLDSVITQILLFPWTLCSYLSFSIKLKKPSPMRPTLRLFTKKMSSTIPLWRRLREIMNSLLHLPKQNHLKIYSKTKSKAIFKFNLPCYLSWICSCFSLWLITIMEMLTPILLITPFSFLSHKSSLLKTADWMLCKIAIITAMQNQC